MATLNPILAPVRPRVCGDGIDASRLLEEVVEEYAEDSSAGLLWVVGSNGAGKSTALAHLAAVFLGNPHVAFLDDGDNLDDAVVCENFRALDEKVFVVASRCGTCSSAYPQLSLEPWGVDEILEYLLARHREQCSDVMQRLGLEANGRWDPEVARIILDEFAFDVALAEVSDALLKYIRRELGSERKWKAAREQCLCTENGKGKSVLQANFFSPQLPVHISKLLRHRLIQIPLAAEQLVEELRSWKSPKVLERQMSLSLVEAVGRLCEDEPDLRAILQHVLCSRQKRKCHAMAASILLAADPDWRPTGERAYEDLAGGYFPKARWSDVCLAGLTLQLAEFNEAQLVRTNFDKAVVVEADFVGANLHDSSFEETLAVGADFDRADLRYANLRQTKLEHACLSEADLRHADLWKANLCGADLTLANFEDAKLSEAVLVGANLDQTQFRGADMTKVDARRVDFRTVNLEEANLQTAWLNGANFEDMQWNYAKLSKSALRGALLTGSRLLSADLRRADLSEACLGEIDWEHADLRNANLARSTFHMGSSRSGLLDTPIASEGTRTGFYTDELEELYFKTPEQVRKANLRGADLRGTDISDVDFYLVDLREARLDPFQLDQARRTGAILSE